MHARARQGKLVWVDAQCCPTFVCKRIDAASSLRDACAQPVLLPAPAAGKPVAEVELRARASDQNCAAV